MDGQAAAPIVREIDGFRDGPDASPAITAASSHSRWGMKTPAPERAMLPMSSTTEAATPAAVTGAKLRGFHSDKRSSTATGTEEVGPRTQSTCRQRRSPPTASAAPPQLANLPHPRRGGPARHEDGPFGTQGPPVPMVMAKAIGFTTPRAAPSGFGAPRCCGGLRGFHGPN